LLTEKVSRSYYSVMVDMPKKVIGLFDELIARGEQIKESCKKMYFAGAKKAVEAQVFEAWRTSCLTLLRSTFGSSSPHCDSFSNLKFFDYYNSTLLYLGILQGAREDLRKGYFYHKDLMLSVNILNSFLARSSALLAKGETAKAAGILDAVVCESVRKLAETLGQVADPPENLSCSADALLGVGAVSRETRDKLLAFQEFITGPSTNEPAAFRAWLEWGQSFLYEHLGSKIVIVN
jgi:hypothetical protein